MKRGDLYWANLKPRSGSEQQGHRPIVIVSSDGFNEVASWCSIIVIPVTSSPRQAGRGPTTVSLAVAGTGLSQDSIAICHQITTLDRSKIQTKIGVLSEEEMGKIEQGIFAACDLGP